MLVTTAIVGVRQERAVALVGLGHEEVAGAEARVGAERGHLPADDDGGIEAGGAEHGGHERGRRRLAVRAGDGHAVLHAHELGEHLGAGDDRDAEGAGLGDLGVVAVDRARVHDDVHARDVLVAVPEIDAHAQGLKPAGGAALFHVRARHVELERAEDLGQAAHPHAPDADEVYVPDASAKH